jgi:Alw26I/Eco31I/Esp3I family type II restriction m6 adenine DNA methyltransferase
MTSSLPLPIPELTGDSDSLGPHASATPTAASLNGKDLLVRSAGVFYTHELIGRHLARALVAEIRARGSAPARIVDPFCGDGRLVAWLVEELHAAGLGDQHMQVSIWDCDRDSVAKAESRVRTALSSAGMDADIDARSWDTFVDGLNRAREFDIVVTNPPWEVLKPDRRELEALSDDQAERYVAWLRERDGMLSTLYPNSRPTRRFSGWGTNLARCGIELSLMLTSEDGVCGVVAPMSLMADQVSVRLRSWMFHRFDMREFSYYPAEARLFENVDQPAMTFVARRGGSDLVAPRVTRYNRDREIVASRKLSVPLETLLGVDFVFPLHLPPSCVDVLFQWEHLPTFGELEGPSSNDLWAGRELDETGYKSYLADTGTHLFAKGRMVRRFGITEQPTAFVSSSGPRIPSSADQSRLVWRDVSRPTQKRRIHATIIPPGWVTGNSLHVAYFRDGDQTRLMALLAVLNSLVFEFQVRAFLATGHISLGAVRKARMPDLGDPNLVARFADVASLCMSDHERHWADLEVAVGRAYGVDTDQLESVLECFPKLSEAERDILRTKWTE